MPITPRMHLFVALRAPLPEIISEPNDPGHHPPLIVRRISQQPDPRRWLDDEHRRFHRSGGPRSDAWQRVANRKLCGLRQQPHLPLYGFNALPQPSLFAAEANSEGLRPFRHLSADRWDVYPLLALTCAEAGAGLSWQ